MIAGIIPFCCVCGDQTGNPVAIQVGSEGEYALGLICIKLPVPDKVFYSVDCWKSIYGTPAERAGLRASQEG